MPKHKHSPTDYTLAPQANLADLVDLISPSLVKHFDGTASLLVTSHDNLMGAAIIHLNFEEGEFKSLTLIPFDNAEQAKRTLQELDQFGDLST